jgi:hypothetical protein
VRVAIIGAAVMSAVTVAPRATACECFSGVWPWPPSGSTIPRNGIIVLRGNDQRHRDLVAYIDERRPALACGKRVVPLRMKDLYIGHNEVKALLAPTRALPPLTRCDLLLTSRGRRSSDPISWINSVDPLKGGPEPPFWNTAAAADRHPPIWTAAPHWTGEPGRGPACGLPGGWVSLKASAARHR